MNTKLKHPCSFFEYPAVTPSDFSFYSAVLFTAIFHSIQQFLLRLRVLYFTRLLLQFYIYGIVYSWHNAQGIKSPFLPFSVTCWTPVYCNCSDCMCPVSHTIWSTNLLLGQCLVASYIKSCLALVLSCFIIRIVNSPTSGLRSVSLPWLFPVLYCLNSVLSHSLSRLTICLVPWPFSG
jgi:hypothetical protein